MIFGFMDDAWPDLPPSNKGLGRVLGYALLFVALVVGMMLPFVWHLLPMRR